MTAKKDPRIEAVAKLLFTGPLWGNGPEHWDREDWPYTNCRRISLLAAEDVLRGIEEAAPQVFDIPDELRKAGMAEEDIEDGVRNVRLILKADPDRYWTAMDAAQEALRLTRAKDAKPGGYPGFIGRLRQATLNVDIDTAKLLVEAANVIEDISSNWEPKLDRVAGTVSDLDALPSEAIVRGRTGHAYEKVISNGSEYWLEGGYELTTFSSFIELPAQILWMPEEEK